MKTLFIILISIVAFLGFASQEAFAQRFGSRPNQDNSYRNLNLALVNYSLVAGVDTVKLRPGAFETHVRCATALNDSVAIQVTSTANSKIGDQIYINLRSDGNSRRVKLLSGTPLVVGSTNVINLPANKSFLLALYYDGARWLEQYRFTQP